MSGSDALVTWTFMPAMKQPNTPPSTATHVRSETARIEKAVTAHLARGVMHGSAPFAPRVSTVSDDRQAGAQPDGIRV